MAELSVLQWGELKHCPEKTVVKSTGISLYVPGPYPVQTRGWTPALGEGTDNRETEVRLYSENPGLGTCGTLPSMSSLRQVMQYNPCSILDNAAIS